MSDRQTVPSSPNTPTWEDAYLRFETPEQEVRKFIRRLRGLGADGWPREARIVDLFCGRGNGLQALHRLGFACIDGVDLSASLAAHYVGPGHIHVGDCRAMPLPDGAYDIAIVQGGLHHLEQIPGDLDATLAEARRILRPGGLFVAVEPWLTPFLRAVHALSRRRALRRAWARIDALQSMIEQEERTYFQWLSRPGEVMGIFERHFAPQRVSARWGKVLFVGERREG